MTVANSALVREALRGFVQNEPRYTCDRCYVERPVDDGILAIKTERGNITLYCPKCVEIIKRRMP